METWLEIDLNKLRSNYNYIKNKTGVEICSVIKADGYGIGAFEIAKELEKMDTKLFAVAFLNEAEELRKEGIKKDILIFNYVSPKTLQSAIDNNFIITLYSLDQLKIYQKEDIELDKLRFHIKINTGMNRLGINESDLEEILTIISEENIKVEGVYSHFANAETDEDFTDYQYERFKKIVDKMENSLKQNNILKHIANSPASLKYNSYYLNLVRIGMILYGLQPLDRTDENIKGIFTWKSKISNIRKVSEGERISYGKERITEDKTIAVVPVGYSHGYMRQLSNIGYVMVEGRRCDIIGKICMDQMIIDVTHLEELEIGNEVIILGEGITAEKLGELSGTIADDIICKISSKIERVVKRIEN